MNFRPTSFTFVYLQKLPYYGLICRCYSKNQDFVVKISVCWLSTILHTLYRECPAGGNSLAYESIFYIFSANLYTNFEDIFCYWAVVLSYLSSSGLATSTVCHYSG